MTKKKKKSRRKTKNLRRTAILEQESGGRGGGEAGAGNPPLVGNVPDEVVDDATRVDDQVFVSAIHQLAQTTATTLKHEVATKSSRKRKATEFRSQGDSNHQEVNARNGRLDKGKCAGWRNNEGKPKSKHRSLGSFRTFRSRMG